MQVTYPEKNPTQTFKAFSYRENASKPSITEFTFFHTFNEF